MSQAEDLAGINAALARYIDGVNQRDPELWATSWDQDGEWHLFGPETVRSRDAIVAAWTEAMAGFPFVVMHVSQGHVEVDGDHAHGRSYTSEIVETADGKRLRVWGCYTDQYRRRDAVWRFSSRKFAILNSEEY